MGQIQLSKSAVLQHKNRQIEVDKQFGGDRMLDCALGQRNQVLGNLLANAADAIDAQWGKITIHTGVEEGC